MHDLGRHFAGNPAQGASSHPDIIGCLVCESTADLEDLWADGAVKEGERGMLEHNGCVAGIMMGRFQGDLLAEAMDRLTRALSPSRERRLGSNQTKRRSVMRDYDDHHRTGWMNQEQESNWSSQEPAGFIQSQTCSGESAFAGLSMGSIAHCWLAGTWQRSPVLEGQRRSAVRDSFA